MHSPFPGMDPYLEDKAHWAGFHHHLAEEVMTLLNATLNAKYYAEVEVHTVLDEINIATTHHIYPDVAVLEATPQEIPPTVMTPVLTAPLQRVAIPAGQVKLRAVHIYTTMNKELVTTLEILSPINKQGQGLTRYREKRERLLHSHVHVVELDLLRGGQRPGWELQEPPLDTDYVCLVNRASYGQDRISEIWPIALSDPLPNLPIPLLPPDADILLGLGEALQNIYTRAAYARRLNYEQPIPTPALRPAMREWVAQLQASYPR